MPLDLAKIQSTRTSFERMLKEMRARKKKRLKANDYQGALPVAEYHHKYFVVFRPTGHNTMRQQSLDRGDNARERAKIFLDVMGKECDYLMFYQIHGLTGEVTAYDPLR